jgi:hypothetical protein
MPVMTAIAGLPARVEAVHRRNRFKQTEQPELFTPWTGESDLVPARH